MTEHREPSRAAAPDLREAWDSLWEGIGCRPEEARRDAAYDDLARRYGGLHRHYFRLAHVARTLKTFALFRPGVREPFVIEAAIWFSHAAHFTFGDDVNRGFVGSADLACRVLTAGGAPYARVQRACVLIRALDRPLAIEADDERLLLDMERSVFALDNLAFERYERLLRREYQRTFDDRTWCHFRVAQLEEVMRQGIFLTEPARKMLLDRAQRNISNAIARLRGGIVRS